MKTLIADLLARMENDDPDIRADAACHIGESGTKDKRAIAAPIRHLKDDNSQVRAFSSRALGAIGGKAALKPLMNSLCAGDLYWNSNAAANALGDLGDSAAVPRQDKVANRPIVLRMPANKPTNTSLENPSGERRGDEA